MGGIQAFYPAQEVPLQIKNGFQIPGNEEKNSLERANKILECIKQMFNFFFLTGFLFIIRLCISYLSTTLAYLKVLSFILKHHN